MLQGERNSPITMIFRRGGGAGGEQVVVTLLRAGVAKALIAAALNNAEASSAPGERSFLESMTGLKSEFSNLSFLWGEPINDAVHENMRDWKENMLYGTLLPLDMSSSFIMRTLGEFLMAISVMFEVGISGDEVSIVSKRKGCSQLTAPNQVPRENFQLTLRPCRLA